MTQTAIFGAGCFWGVQYYFDQVPGIVATTAGYAGGHTDNPTYEQVCSHTTGHAEVLKIEFDSGQITYETLVKHFFRMHDPTQLNRQGPDVGDSYRSIILYAGDAQKDTAENTKAGLDADGSFKKPIVTTIEKAGTFWPAEAYHQKFSERTGQGMCHIPYKAIA